MTELHFRYKPLNIKDKLTFICSNEESLNEVIAAVEEIKTNFYAEKEYKEILEKYRENIKKYKQMPYGSVIHDCCHLNIFNLFFKNKEGYLKLPRMSGATVRMESFKTALEESGKKVFFTPSKHYLIKDSCIRGINFTQYDYVLLENYSYDEYQKIKLATKLSNKDIKVICLSTSNDLDILP